MSDPTAHPPLPRRDQTPLQYLLSSQLDLLRLGARREGVQDAACRRGGRQAVHPAVKKLTTCPGTCRLFTQAFK
ncbi:MAG: hypothetical protein ACRDRH_14250 [Pseudonocardia sp.]